MRTINRAKFTAKEKCSWVVKSKEHAPTFLINKETAFNMLPSTYDLHYIEYDSTVARQSTTDWIDPRKSNFEGTNLIYAKKYDKTEFNNIEYPFVHSIINPQDPTAE